MERFKPSKIAKALKLSYDPYPDGREELAHPFKQWGALWARNEHHAIRFLMGFLPFMMWDSYKNQSTPDMQRANTFERTMNKVITLDDVRKVVDLIPTKKVNRKKPVECPECGGNRYVTFFYEASDGKEYEEDCDCPVCEGAGTIDVDDPEHYDIVRQEDFFIELDGKYFGNSGLVWLESVMTTLGLKEIQLVGTPGLFWFAANPGVELFISQVINVGEEDQFAHLPATSPEADEQK